MDSEHCGSRPLSAIRDQIIRPHMPLYVVSVAGDERRAVR